MRGYIGGAAGQEAGLEKAVARAGRYREEIDLTAAHEQLADWRRSQLRSMWEFADTAYFLQTFQDHEVLVSLPEFDHVQLAEMILRTEEETLSDQLHTALVKLIWPNRRSGMTEKTWFKVLLRGFREIQSSETKHGESTPSLASLGSLSDRS